MATAIAEGHRSAALLDQLGKRERELDDISDELLAADGRGLDARLQEIEAFVQERLQDIRGLLFADVPRLSKHCKAITLTPGGIDFPNTGDWNLNSRSGFCGFWLSGTPNYVLAMHEAGRIYGLTGSYSRLAGFAP